MSLTAADIIAIIQAGGSVDIEPSGSIRITPAEAKTSRAERNRRHYLNRKGGRLKASENDLKRLKASESDGIKTPPSPPPSPSPGPPTPPAPTPVSVHGARVPTCEEPELSETGSESESETGSEKPHKRIFWTSETGFTGIFPEDRTAWAEAYPACDIVRQLSSADLWLRANPVKRKKNVFRFLMNWLSRQQERGGDAPRGSPAAPAKPPLRPVNPDKWKIAE